MIRPALRKAMIERIEREKAATTASTRGAESRPVRPDLFGKFAAQADAADSSDLVNIDGELRRETQFSYLIFDGASEAWVPKSLVEHDPRERSFAMPQWLAREKGLI